MLAHTFLLYGLCIENNTEPLLCTVSCSVGTPGRVTDQFCIFSVVNSSSEKKDVVRKW